MLMGCLSTSKEGKRLTRKLCSWSVNLEVESSRRVPAEGLVCAQHMDMSLVLSLSTAPPKSPRGQNQDKIRPAGRIRREFVVYVIAAD